MNEPFALDHRVYWIFIGLWMLFWGTAGGIVCHKFKGKGLQGALAGATLFIIGIMLVLVSEDEPKPPADGKK